MLKNNILENIFSSTLVFLVFFISFVSAQDQAIENTSIDGTANYQANSITVGPDVTIGSSGDVTLNSKTLAVKPPFIILGGGQLHVISQSVAVSLQDEENIRLPDNFSVAQNYPNPFNPLTFISYDLPKTAHVHIDIFNLAGQKIRDLVDGEQAAGRYTVSWDATDSQGKKVSSGIYFYSIKAGTFSMVKKMTLIK